jgi:hypothetical protein
VQIHIFAEYFGLTYLRVTWIIDGRVEIILLFFRVRTAAIEVIDSSDEEEDIQVVGVVTSSQPEGAYDCS